MMTAFRYIIVLLTIVGTLLWIPASRANDLRGRLFLGEGLDIEMELREGTFSEFLRYLRLRDSPRSVVNLSDLGRSGDKIFIGDDMKLYVSSERDQGAAYPIGSASELWSMRLDDDVGLLTVSEISGLFAPSGGGVEHKLRVRMRRPRPRAHTVQQADFTFWLQELVYEYDRFQPRNRSRQQDNYPYIADAIRTALPRDAEPSRSHMTNLSYLERYVHRVDAHDLIPLRRLLSSIIDEIRSRDMEPTVMDRYHDILATVIRRTDGL